MNAPKETFLDTVSSLEKRHLTPHIHPVTEKKDEKKVSKKKKLSIREMVILSAIYHRPYQDE